MVKPQVYLRIGLLLTVAVGFLLYIWIYSGRTPQYEVIEPGVLYRAVYTAPQEYVNAANASHCSTSCAVFSEAEALQPPADGTLMLASRGKIRYRELRIPNGHAPTSAQVEEFLTWMGKGSFHPMLLISPTGERTAMLAAAYRLSVMHMSLEQTVAAIDQCDSSQDAKKAAKAFAQRYAATMPKPATTRTTQRAP